MKAMAIATAGLVLSVSVSAAVLPATEVRTTPYDPYLGVFRQIAARPASANAVTMDQVEEWTWKASKFDYSHDDDYHWKTPEQLDAAGAGDCKDKALWLYSKLHAAGAHDLTMVIGKKDAAATEYHAWLYLRLGGKTFLLDPTTDGRVWEVTDFGESEYIPVYGYMAGRAFAYGTSDPRYGAVASR